MKILKELTIILIVYFISTLINLYIIPVVPGTIIGMIILLFLFLTGVLKVSNVETTGNFLLNNLSFFFIPSAIGIITVFDIIKENFFSIMFIIIVSTIIVIVTTGYTVQFLKRVIGNERTNE